ncbi:outer membrane beta-barrel protein [Pontibacter beigongshangensis]|uniref:outer membrane beta-barrel protein n=1 Tax=Pontibacter beigongshangensis TaxID=2574733 RepID=UPI00164F497B|nr:outer membrane beta-barrel protein [Pontibacter beigongshangensis]
MKTLFLSLILLTSLAVNVQAQTEKGSKMLGGIGNIGLSDGFTVLAQPNLGFFVADNFAAGTSLLLFYSKQNNFRNAGIGVQPFLRYYIGESLPVRPFVEANGGYLAARSKYTGEGFAYDNKNNSHFFGGGLGAAYFLTNQIGLEAMLYYRSNENPVLVNYQGSSKLGISFGFQIYLPGSAAK